MKISLQARIRAFQIWQKLGYNPWKRPRTPKDQKSGGEGGEFYKGAFDSIPFLNDDAKRTFVHLLLRPGYMIRDYINGKHDRYLAPLTALIVFYAFFSLISAALQPLENKKDDKANSSIEFEDSKKDDAKEESTLEVAPEAIEEAQNSLKGLNLFVEELRLLPHLDEHPEAVDSRPKPSLQPWKARFGARASRCFWANSYSSGCPCAFACESKKSAGRLPRRHRHTSSASSAFSCFSPSS